MDLYNHRRSHQVDKDYARKSSLREMEEVRNFLLANNIIDDLALEDYLKELNIS